MPRHSAHNKCTINDILSSGKLTASNKNQITDGGTIKFMSK